MSQVNRVVPKLRKMTLIVGYWPKRRRYVRPGRSRHLSQRSKTLSLMGGISLAVMALLLLGSQVLGAFSSAWNSLAAELPLSDSLLKAVFQEGLPMLEAENVQYKPPATLAASLLSALTTINLETPRGLLESQFSYMEEMEIEAVSIPLTNSGSQEAGAGEEVSQLAPENSGEGLGEKKAPGETDEKGGGEGTPPGETAGDNPLVGIYTTHNAEKYAGEEKSTGSRGAGENVGVMRVARVLETTLREEYQVPAERSKQIHDYPDWNLSYTKSKETGKSLLSKNPSIQILIDVHRDAGIKEKHSVVINGRSAAKVLLIVGSAQRLENPNWKKNKEFAEKVDAKMDELYPGLSRGVRVQSGRYNQHLHPHAILLEMGNAKNSPAEAEVSAELMAHVISQVLKDISERKL